MTVSRRLRVLVIEDEPIISMAIEFSVEHMGHAMVGPIARLEDAMEAAIGDDFDCAIVDVNIIGGASHEVMTILSERHRPFILASGYNDASLPEALRNQRRLVKPYSGDQLEVELERLFKACDRRS